MQHKSILKNRFRKQRNDFVYNIIVTFRDFFSFPHEPNLKQKWIEAMGNKDWFPTKHSTICSVHFEEASFVEGKKQRILTKAAYPTVDVLKITTDEVS